MRDRDLSKIKKCSTIFIIRQVNPSVMQQLNNLKEYKLIEDNNNLIKIIKCLCNIFYANKDDGMTFTP